jgi:hypothetical protein
MQLLLGKLSCITFRGTLLVIVRSKFIWSIGLKLQNIQTLSRSSYFKPSHYGEALNLHRTSQNKGARSLAKRRTSKNMKQPASADRVLVRIDPLAAHS